MQFESLLYVMKVAIQEKVPIFMFLIFVLVASLFIDDGALHIMEYVTFNFNNVYCH